MSEIEELRLEILGNRIMVEKLQKRVARLEGYEAQRKMDKLAQQRLNTLAEKAQEEALQSVYMDSLMDDCY